MEAVKLRTLFGYSLFILWVFLIVDGIFPQLQMALFGEHVIIPSIALKFMLLLLLFIAAITLMKQQATVPRGLFLLWWTFSIYLLIDALIFSVRFSYPLDYLLFSYNAYYFFLLILPLIFFANDLLSEKIIVFYLMSVYLPLAILGLAQNVLKDPILPVVSADGFFRVFSWEFYGQVRAFSLFSSAFQLGHYTALIGALGICFLNSKKDGAKSLGFAFIVLVLATGFTTLTRATYLEISMTVVTAWMLLHSKRFISKHLVPLLPLLYGAVGIFVAFILPRWISLISGQHPLLSNDSLLMRYTSWDVYGNLWMDSDLFTKLFGIGLIQNSRFSITEEVLIDNSFLAIIVHIGLLGLVIWLGLMWKAWQYTLEVAKKQESYLAIAIAAVWSTWIAISIFGIVTEIYPLLLTLLMISLNKKRSMLSCNNTSREISR